MVSKEADQDMIDLISDQMYYDQIDPDLIEKIADKAKEDDDIFESMLKWYRYPEQKEMILNRFKMIFNY